MGEKAKDVWHFGTVLIILLVPLIIVVIDEILRVVVGQDVLSVFVSEHNLNLTGD